MENYTKYKLKAADELKAALEKADNLFVIACNKCYKEFTDTYEPDLDEFLKLAEEMGKTVGKDAAEGKLTYVALYGVEESRIHLQTLTNDAIEAIRPFDKNGFFEQLALDMLARKH